MLHEAGRGMGAVGAGGSWKETRGRQREQGADTLTPKHVSTRCRIAPSAPSRNSNSLPHSLQSRLIDLKLLDHSKPATQMIVRKRKRGADDLVDFGIPALGCEAASEQQLMMQRYTRPAEHE